MTEYNQHQRTTLSDVTAGIIIGSAGVVSSVATSTSNFFLGAPEISPDENMKRFGRKLKGMEQRNERELNRLENQQLSKERGLQAMVDSKKYNNKQLIRESKRLVKMNNKSKKLEQREKAIYSSKLIYDKMESINDTRQLFSITNDVAKMAAAPIKAGTFSNRVMQVERNISDANSAQEMMNDTLNQLCELDDELDDEEGVDATMKAAHDILNQMSAEKLDQLPVLQAPPQKEVVPSDLSLNDRLAALSLKEKQS